MRYGVIGLSPKLPDPDDQRRAIQDAGCDMLLEDPPSRLADQGSLLPLLARLRQGDEVLVHSLEVFRASTGEIAVLLLAFQANGVTLRLVGGQTLETLAPSASPPRSLTLLAEHERRRPTRSSARRRACSTARTLTPHQLRFALDMHRRGYSLREIGLLFQLSPKEVSMALGRGAPIADGSHPPADPDTPAIG